MIGLDRDATPPWWSLPGKNSVLLDHRRLGLDTPLKEHSGLLDHRRLFTDY
jgi:hypothetical protein